MKSMMTGGESETAEESKNISFAFERRLFHFHIVLSPAHHVAGTVVLNKYL